LSLVGAVLIITNNIFIASLIVLTGGFFDMVDGALARTTNRVTSFGSILDSTLDRISEAAILLAIVVFYTKNGFTPGVILASITLPVSFLVSYVRARAEAMDLECKVGLFTRPERIVVLFFGLLLSQINLIFLTIALGVIILFSSITVGQRLLYVWQQTKN